MKNVKMSLKQEVWRHFKEKNTVFLATSQGKQPRVRPVSLIYFRKKFWITTGTTNAKIEQIKKNNNIEFCLLLRTKKYAGYIRGTGKARIVKNRKVRKLLADNLRFFATFWKGPDDPNYTLLAITVKEIEYVKPGYLGVERFSL